MYLRVSCELLRFVWVAVAKAAAPPFLRLREEAPRHDVCWNWVICDVSIAYT